MKVVFVVNQAIMNSLEYKAVTKVYQENLTRYKIVR
jgi:hypothetical protein